MSMDLLRKIFCHLQCNTVVLMIHHHVLPSIINLLPARYLQEIQFATPLTIDSLPSTWCSSSTDQHHPSSFCDRRQYGQNHVWAIIHHFLDSPVGSFESTNMSTISSEQTLWVRQCLTETCKIYKVADQRSSLPASVHKTLLCQELVVSRKIINTNKKQRIVKEVFSGLINFLSLNFKLLKVETQPEDKNQLFT